MYICVYVFTNLAFVGSWLVSLQLCALALCTQEMYGLAIMYKFSCTAHVYMGMYEDVYVYMIVTLNGVAML